ncbi:MAG: adenylate/guanylate cyclase domain-containing protein [Myxococcota bacterium]
MVEEPARARRKLAAILMADVSGFSRMMARDEEWTTREIQAFHARVQGRVTEFEGRGVDTAGDSVFGEFDSVVLATRCAQAIQEDQAERNLDLPAEQRIETRIGVHVGDVIVEEYKIYGDGVNIASRLESLAEPGGIMVSEAVYQQVRNKVPGDFSDQGMRTLKNIDHPVRVYRLQRSSLVTTATRPGTPSSASSAPAHVRPRTRREERMMRRAGARGRTAVEPPAPATSFVDQLLRADVATLLVVGLFLLATPLLFFPTAGLAPTGGAVLVGLTLGRVMRRVRRRRGDLLVGLGLGIALGALFTNWSTATDFLFVLAGAIVAVQGLSLSRRSAPGGP